MPLFFRNGNACFLLMMKLDPKRVFEYDSPLDHSFLFQIEDQLRSHTDLFFAPRHPQPSPALDERKPIIPQILEEDKLIHYPYESIPIAFTFC